MNRPLKGLFALACASLAATPAFAHAVAGNRVFPATIATDDPGVADELSLPTISTSNSSDDPSVRETDYSFEYAKTLTEDFGLSIDGTWVDASQPGSPRQRGFDNFGITAKYHFLTNDAHELIMSAGLETEIGGSGASRIADSYTTFTPSLYFGKGMGDLPDSLSLLKPLAVTGVVGYSIPSSSNNIDSTGAPNYHGRALEYGGAVEYSMSYLKANVRDFGLPDFVNRLTPLVEFAIEKPTANSDEATTGTINPGVIWSGDSFQIGAEAMLPINRSSGVGVGAIVQIHFFLDDIMPTTLGKPIFQ
jgi:hypothetical protein